MATSKAGTGRFIAALAASAALGACGGGGAAEDPSGELALALASGGISGISTKASATVGECAYDQAPVYISGSFTTHTGGQVTITAQVDGGSPLTIGTYTEFVNDRSQKSGTFSYDLTLAKGSHTVRVCAYQVSGGPHNPPSCVDLYPEVVCPDAEGKDCSTAEPYGAVVQNPNVGRENPGLVPVQVRGDLGDAPQLFVYGPNGYYLKATLAHAGESCTYHYNLARAEAPAGDYRFKVVSGTGITFEFSGRVE